MSTDVQPRILAKRSIWWKNAWQPERDRVKWPSWQSDGRLAQLVAHPLDGREGTSSSLVSSTKNKRSSRKGWPFCFCCMVCLELVTNLSAPCARIMLRTPGAVRPRPQVRVLYRPPWNPNRKVRIFLYFRQNRPLFASKSWSQFFKTRFFTYF